MRVSVGDVRLYFDVSGAGWRSIRTGFTSG